MAEHRDEILEACEARIRAKSPAPTAEELQDSIPEFFDEIVAALRADVGLERETSPAEESKSAREHGRQRFGLGFNLGGVVHDYGSLCEAITDAAKFRHLDVSAREYQLLNQVLDAGIAEAVADFSEASTRHRDREVDRKATEHLGFIAHELRNALSAAMLAFDAIRRGQVAVGGRTGHILERSLLKLRSLIDRSLTEVRLKSGLEVEREPMRLVDLLDEVGGVGLTSDQHEIEIDVDPRIVCALDRQLITSALGNLVQNASKYSPAGTTISLRGRQEGDGVVLEVEDQCGGIATEKLSGLFTPFVRGGQGGEGLGLGLAIARQAAEAHGGRIRVRNVPRKGCVFSIDLPGSAVRQIGEEAHPIH